MFINLYIYIDKKLPAYFDSVYAYKMVQKSYGIVATILS